MGFGVRDLGIRPEFRLSVDDLTGTIDGLSSEVGARARVDLGGQIDKQALIQIKGEINPFDANAFSDLTTSVADLPLPPFSPYAGKFAGYTIDRGAVDLELVYRLNGRTLEADNRISLSEFDFGEAVESDSATSLPIPLAVALMRDTSGQISIDLPIRGNLDDPSFSVLGLVGKAFVQLITKVVTTPFALVGDLVGGSEEDLASIAFAPGSRSPNA